MATQPIQTNDIIQDNLLKKTIAEFNAWSKVIKVVEEDLIQLANVTKKGIKLIDEKDSKSIVELNAKLLELKKQTKALDLAKKESEKASNNIIKLRKEETDAILRNEKVLQAEERTKQQALRTQDLTAKGIIREVKEQERLEKERQKQIKGIKSEDDAYKQLSKQRTKAQNEYKRLAVEIGENSKEAQEALEIFNELDATFTKVNVSVKDGRPFVGRYADAIKEAGLEGGNTVKILIDLKEEQEELNKVLIKQRKEFGKNSKEVKQSEVRLKRLDETIEEIEKSSKSTEKAIDRLTGAVKAFATASILLKAFEFVSELFTSSDEGADGLAKTLGRLVITVQVLVGRTVKSFNAFKNNFFVLINDIQLGFFEFVDSLNSKPLKIFGKELFDGQVSNVTEKLKELRKEQSELSKANTNLSSSFEGVTEEINRKIEANDKAIDQERSNIKQIARLELESAKLSKTLEGLALIYDDDSQALTDRSKSITEAILLQGKLNKSNVNAIKLEVETARLRANASTGNSQAQADFINAQARLIEVETQGLTELNNLRRESNSINRDVRDLELDVLLDNVDNIKTVNERKIADESLAQDKRKKILDENVKNIEESFKLQAEVVNKELSDLEKPILDFNELLNLSSEELAKFLTDNTGETQAIRILEILKERRTALQDIVDTQKELSDSDKEIIKTNAEIILQEQALLDLSKEGADSEEILKKLEDDRALLKIDNLKKEIELLQEKNNLEGGDSLELLSKKKELNDLLLEGESERIEKESELEEKSNDEKVERFKSLQNTITNALEDALNARFERIQAELDRELEASEKQQDRLQDLADKGGKEALESLQLERQKEEELRREKAVAEQQQLRAKKAFAAYEVLINNDGNVTKTASDILLVEALIKSLPTFEKGTQDTGKGGKGVDNKGGFLNILHPNEGVIKSETNKKKLKAGLTNETAVDYAIKYQHLKPKINQKTEIIPNNQELKDIKKILKDLPNNMPTQDLFFDEQEKAYVRILKQDGKINRIHSRSKGLFR